MYNFYVFWGRGEIITFSHDFPLQWSKLEIILFPVTLNIIIFSLIDVWYICV
jgi:hypothetical protein